MLRHQSTPVQQDERNNSVALTVGDGQGTLGRAQKNLYAPGLPSKDNRREGLGNESEAVSVISAASEHILFVQ